MHRIGRAVLVGRETVGRLGDTLCRARVRYLASMVLALTTVPATSTIMAQFTGWSGDAVVMFGAGGGPSMRVGGDSASQDVGWDELFSLALSGNHIGLRAEWGDQYTRGDMFGPFFSLLWYVTSGETSWQPYLLGGAGALGSSDDKSDKRLAYGAGAGLSVALRRPAGWGFFLEARFIQKPGAGGGFNVVPITIGVAAFGPLIDL